MCVGSVTDEHCRQTCCTVQEVRINPTPGEVQQHR
jgi:hypothetical protein